MDIQPLAISGSWVVTPKQFGDARGVFMEYFKADSFAAVTGHDLTLAQANCSVSARGVTRGIHFADVPPGQAKYVTCARGSIVDVIVDLRVGSPTFGHHEVVPLDDVSRKAVYLSEGLGHGFMALSDDATVLYLCSTGYNPAREHGVHPLDAELSIAWPSEGADGNPLRPILSDKDATAPTLRDAMNAGSLPTWDACQEWIQHGLSART